MLDQRHQPDPNKKIAKVECYLLISKKLFKSRYLTTLCSWNRPARPTYSVELHGSFVYCCRLSFPSFHAAIASFSAVFIAVNSFMCLFAFASGEGNVLLCVYVSVCIIIQNVAGGLDEILSVDRYRANLQPVDFWASKGFRVIMAPTNDHTVADWISLQEIC